MTNIKHQTRLLLLFLFTLLSAVSKGENEIYTIRKDTLIVNEGVTDIYSNDIDKSLTSSIVVLPKSLGWIGDNAFYNMDFTDINIPESVTYIGENAFGGCEKLNKIIYYNNGKNCYGWVGEEDSCPKKIVIPEGVVTIDNHAFRNCNAEEIVLPEGLKNIGKNAFSYTLKKINIPNSVKNIGDEAIDSNTELNVSQKGDYPGLLIYDNGTKCYGWIGLKHCPEKIVIPEGVTYINKGAFSHNDIITEVVFPESLTEISDNVFSRSRNLKKATVSKDLKYIGVGAFLGCQYLETSVPEDCEVRECAFDNCYFVNLLQTCNNKTVCKGWTNKTYAGKVILPSTIKVIADNAFEGCQNIQEIILPDGLDSIGKNAFYHCESLGHIEIPNSVKHIGRSAFSYCKNLRTATLPDSINKIPQSMFYGCIRLRTIEIPNTVALIGSWAFASCSELDSVKYPTGMFIVEEFAFKDCNSLSIDNIPKKAKLHRDTFETSTYTSILNHSDKIAQFLSIILFWGFVVICLHIAKNYSWRKSLIIGTFICIGIAVIIIVCIIGFICVCFSNGYHG